MIPSSMLAQTAFAQRNDRVSNELRSYARLEWHADLAWLLSQIRTPETSRRTPLRRWIRRRLRAERRQPASAAGKPVGAQTTIANERTRPPDDCRHSLTEFLGAAGAAEFLRCVVCGGVLVIHDGLQWAIRQGGSKDGTPESPKTGWSPSTERHRSPQGQDPATMPADGRKRQIRGGFIRPR